MSSWVPTVPNMVIRNMNSTMISNMDGIDTIIVWISDFMPGIDVVAFSGRRIRMVLTAETSYPE